MASPHVSHVLHRLKQGKREKIFLSETRRPRLLIFGIKLHLVDLCQICSNYSPGAKKWPGPGVHMFFIGLYRKNVKKIFLSETRRPRALIFGM